MSGMKKLGKFLIIFGLAICFIACAPSPTATASPMNDLLGQWALTGEFNQSGEATGLNLQINEIAPSDEEENTYLVTGCMQTESAGGWAPLSMQAVFNEKANEYQVNILSTLLLPIAEPKTAIIRLTGNATLASPGIKDDRAEGTSFSALGETAWKGEHVHAVLSECPKELDEALHFQGEVGNRRDLASSPPIDGTNFLAETNIVSSQMQVELPNGEQMLIPYETDIFTPYVNFIDFFRYAGFLEGIPVIDQPYKFRLLDLTGKPIPGAESIDRFIYCDHGAATNIRMDFNQENYLELSWDAPETIPGRFDPANGHGFYQINIEKYTTGGGGLYGAEAIGTTHKIPWNIFSPGEAGLPDGHDYGISLSEFEDGTYTISVTSYNNYEPAEGEVGFDCWVLDSNQNLVITKSGSVITEQP